MVVVFFPEGCLDGLVVPRRSKVAFQQQWLMPILAAWVDGTINNVEIYKTNVMNQNQFEDDYADGSTPILRPYQHAMAPGDLLTADGMYRHQGLTQQYFYAIVHELHINRSRDNRFRESDTERENRCHARDLFWEQRDDGNDNFIGSFMVLFGVLLEVLKTTPYDGETPEQDDMDSLVEDCMNQALQTCGCTTFPTQLHR